MTSEINLQEIYEYIVQLVRECGPVFLEGFHGEGIDVIEKDGNYWDLVTEYDNRIENILINAITNRYPNHKFIAEETAAREKSTPELTDDPTWIIDPIDGTSNFIKKFSITAISIAMTWRKEICLGIIYNPITNEFCSALKGKGAFLNEIPIKTNRVENIQNATIAMELSLAAHPGLRHKNVRRFENIIAKCQGLRSLGCAAMSLVYLASGRLDGYQCDDLKPWDMAAGVLIIREAGGAVYATNGGEFDIMNPDVVAACTEQLALELVELSKY